MHVQEPAVKVLEAAPPSDRRPRPSGRRLFWRAIGALLVLCVAGELGLRVWDHFHGATGSLYDYVVPVSTRFKMRPDTAVTVPERYGDIRYSFNHQGYRDRDHDPAWPGPRLMWLGDSVTFGLGVAQDRIFAARVGHELAARRPPWDSMNLAIFAYDTRHELVTLEEDGLAWHPRVVVLEFYMNDLQLSPEHPRPAAVGLGDRLAALKNRLLYKSRLYLRAQQLVLGANYLLFHDLRRRWFPGSLNADEPEAELAYLRARPDDGQVPTFAALGALGRTARQHGARLLVLVSPHELQLATARYDLINQRVEAFCRRRGIATFDPLPALRTRADRAHLFYDSVHYSDHGHEVMAGLLLDAMVRGGYVPPAAQGSAS